MFNHCAQAMPPFLRPSMQIKRNWISIKYNRLTKIMQQSNQDNLRGRANKNKTRELNITNVREWCKYFDNKILSFLKNFTL